MSSRGVTALKFAGAVVRELAIGLWESALWLAWRIHHERDRDPRVDELCQVDDLAERRWAIEERERLRAAELEQGVLHDRELRQ